MNSARRPLVQCPLYLAVLRNNAAKVRRLVKWQGKAILARGPIEYGSTVGFAAAIGAHDALRALLELGAEPNARNAYGTRPPICFSSHADAVRLIAAAGADLEVTFVEGRTYVIMTWTRYREMVAESAVDQLSRPGHTSTPPHIHTTHT